MKYLIFKMAPTRNPLNDSYIKRIIFKILSWIIPIANPDYETIIWDVTYWLLEFEDEEGEEDFPVREIGLDEEYNTILKMPYKNNYGYWTDNNMVFTGFKSTFNATDIEQKFFEEKWDKFN